MIYKNEKICCSKCSFPEFLTSVANYLTFLTQKKSDNKSITINPTQYIIDAQPIRTPTQKRSQALKQIPKEEKVVSKK